MSLLSNHLKLLFVIGIVMLAGCSGAIPSETPSIDAETPDNAATDLADGTVEVHYINVGQSVSTLIIGPDGETMLVDSGHYNDDGEYVLQYLQRHDITRIDHLVSSHNDADHIGGNAAIIDHYETNADGIGVIYDPGIAASTQTYGDYLDTVETHGVTLYETREGDDISFGGADVEVDVLGPPDPYLENEARNENSIVLKITHGQSSFMLSGDAEDDQEQYLVDTYGPQLQSTVLKAGHHGSSSSSSPAFIDAVSPEAVIISSEYDSRYDHPTEEVLTRFGERSIPAYWTATHGDIALVSDGAGVSVQTQRDAPTDPTAVRNGEAIAPGSGGTVTERARLGGDAVEDSEPVDGQTDDVTDDETNGEMDTEAMAPDSALAIERINADAEGDDRENLNDEYIVFANTADEALELSGWTVEDESGRQYTVPEGVTIEADGMLTVRTGSGTDTGTDLYWGSGSPIWNNNGDTIIVSNAAGERVLEVSYE